MWPRSGSAIDPSDRLEKMLAVIAEARGEYGLDITARVNTRHLGVSVNPVEGGTSVLNEYPDVDYLVMAEEDLAVADDTLRYLSWADETFRDTPSVLINCAHSPDNPDPDADPAAVVLLPRFRCWIWATWRDRWHNILAPTWDRSYSTGHRRASGSAGSTTTSTCGSSRKVVTCARCRSHPGHRT